MIALGRSGPAKSNWFQLGGICWFVLSVWPVLHYYFPGKTSNAPIATQSTLLRDQSLSPNILSYRDTLAASRNIDHFASYVRNDKCGFSSLDLHKPTYPVCPEHDTQTLLTAMSGGGRIGNNAPYQPRGCDLRWFSTEEMCDILSRFERITIIGDSLMRDVAIAFHVFLRRDLVNGAQQDWRPSPEGHDCSCEGPWDDRACAWWIAINSDQIYSEHPERMACPKETTAFVKYHTATSWPLPDDQIQGIQESAFPTKPTKPHAVVMGAGLWDDLIHNYTKAWVDQVVNATKEASPWLFEDNQWQPRLFLTPSAAHAGKNPKYSVKQGNIPLSIFEGALGKYVVEKHGIDHLGTYNMSIQHSSYDGTHAGMRVNLLKVMSIMNWLNSLDVSKW